MIWMYILTGGMLGVSGKKILSILERIDAGYRLSLQQKLLLLNVKELDISYSDISSLPKSIGYLKNLEWLYLNHTKIESLPDTISQLSNLRGLHLCSTYISSLPESIGQLVNLQELNLHSSKISALPETLCQLVNLKILCIVGTRINRLPELFGQLSNLECLDIRDTPVSVLSESIGQTCKLKYIYLADTNITHLPESIGEIPSLKQLDLKSLKLSEIPKSLAFRGLPFVEQHRYYNFPAWHYSGVYCPHFTGYGINIADVELTEQDISIFLEHPELIPTLYREKALCPVRECRVIFLGDGASGKSYTIRRFREKGLKETEEKPYITFETPGVEILDYHVDQGADSFNIHFWDFGGQELFHSMHRCFLSEDSCYVITVKTRETKTDERARYWLRNTSTFAPQSPVLLFMNCWDNDDGLRAIDEHSLRKDYPNLKAIVYCSAKYAENEDFRDNLMVPVLNMAATSRGVSTLVPHQWVSVRKAIEQESKLHYYLDKTQYHAICVENGIQDELTPALLSYFNNLGVCFSYHLNQQKKELSDYKLLNPVWLTNALYAIIEEGMVHAKGGQITRDEIVQMLCNRAPDQVRGKRYHRTVPGLVYKEFECQYILDVAIAHDLCYPTDQMTLFFPALCSSNSPQETVTEPKNYVRKVSYLLRYTYLPDSVLHQLMVRCLRNRLFLESCWLRGFVLCVWNLHHIIVRMKDDESLQIDVFSTGNQPPFDIFWLLRKELCDINSKLKLQAKQFILDRGDEFSLEAILEAAADNAFMYGHDGKHLASELIGRFFEETAAQTIRMEGKSIIIPVASREYRSCQKENKALRYGLYEAYNRICPYCGNPISNLREMQVDHILPAKFNENTSLKPYLDYLTACGFDLKKPDYIENYFPTHSHCNRDKSNRVNEFSLPYWHDIATQHAPLVQQLMDEYNRKNQ